MLARISGFYYIQADIEQFVLARSGIQQLECKVDGRASSCVQGPTLITARGASARAVIHGGFIAMSIPEGRPLRLVIQWWGGR
jgi:hypothetical protein